MIRCPRKVENIKLPQHQVIKMKVFLPTPPNNTVHSIMKFVREHVNLDLADQRLYLRPRNGSKLDLRYHVALKPEMTIQEAQIIDGSELRCFLGNRVRLLIRRQGYTDGFMVFTHDLETIQSLKEDIYDELDPKISVSRMVLEPSNSSRTQGVIFGDVSTIRECRLAKDPILLLQDLSI